MANYTPYHVHTSLSNLYTTMDSITKYKQYIDKAKELGIKAIAFSEHGNVVNWVNKKDYCDENGIKYIHAVEAYVTDTLDKKVRDNMHVLLIARNYEGVEEINFLMSHKKATNRKDNHFYYNPRISSEELFGISKNVIVTSACLGGILNSDNKDLKVKLIKYMSENNDRCFLEIQHHNCKDQIEYNQMLYKLSKEYNIRLVAGTDTHSLNEEHVLGVKLLQKAKKIKYNDLENSFDLTFKSYNELVECYKKQNSLPEEIYLSAIHNTNIISDMVDDFQLDRSIKYPKLYDDGLSVLKYRIAEGLEYRKEYIKDIPFSIIKERVNMELETMVKIDAVDFILLEDYVKKSARENNIYCGYARGSASGSFICYLLGITDMNSIKFDLNFFRFLNPDRVSLCDIDSDWYEEDQDWVQSFLLTNNKFNSCHIMTYNTIGLKGAIRDVGRGLNIDNNIIDEIAKNAEIKEQYYRNEYPEIFKYVDILNGTIVSFGSHPAGIVVTDRDITKEFGTVTLNDNDFPVSCINMKEVDSLNFVKLDCLGLDNVGVINQCCEMIGIDRLTPDNVDLNDESVWKSIIEDSTSIFQWESDSAKSFLKKFMSEETLEKVKMKLDNFSMIKWFSYGNGLIRPACAEFRDEVATGNTYDNGLEEINEFLLPTLGRVTMQEDIMMFLVKFCGYSMSEADIVRRGIAKKKGTEQLLPEIEERFIGFASEKYNISKEKCKLVIKPFLQTVLDASSYAFSWNHSDSYSIIGYVLGYLRYYYPVEYLTSSLNVFSQKQEKMTDITYMADKMNVTINPHKFGYSKGKYASSKDTNSIYKGIGSIKYLNVNIGNQLYELSKNKYNNFYELLKDIYAKTTIDARQLEILITTRYFEQFGKSKTLMDIVGIHNTLNGKKQFKFDSLPCSLTMEEVGSFAAKKTAKMFTQVDTDSLIVHLISKLDDIELPANTIMKCELENIGYISYTDNTYNSKVCVVTKVDTNKWGTTFLDLYRLCDGNSTTIKVDKFYYKNKPLEGFDMIMLGDIENKPKRKKVDGKWTISEEKELILQSYSKVVTDEVDYEGQRYEDDIL